MIENHDNETDERQAIEERHRLVTEAERNEWARQVRQEHRRRQREERIYQRFLALPRRPTEPSDQSDKVEHLYDRFQDVPKQNGRQEPSRLLNPDLAALDDHKGHPE